MVRPRFCFKARANNRRITETKRLDDWFFEKERERKRERGGRERERKRRVVGNGRKVAAAVGVATGIRRGPGSPRSATSSRIGSTYHMSKQKRERERERERESLSGESAQRTRPNE